MHGEFAILEAMLMPDRLKNSGHYKLKFFVTPDEFSDILKLFEQKQAIFTITNYEQTQHSISQVQNCYTGFYKYYTSKIF